MSLSDIKNLSINPKIIPSSQLMHAKLRNSGYDASNHCINEHLQTCEELVRFLSVFLELVIQRLR